MEYLILKSTDCCLSLHANLQHWNKDPYFHSQSTVYRISTSLAAIGSLTSSCIFTRVHNLSRTLSSLIFHNVILLFWSVLYTYLLHVCLSGKRDPSSAALPEASSIFTPIKGFVLGSLSLSEPKCLKMQYVVSYAVQSVKPFEGFVILG